MATAAKIDIKLEAQTAALQRDLNGARRRISQFGAQARGTGRSLGGVSSVLGGLGGQFGKLSQAVGPAGVALGAFVLGVIAAKKALDSLNEAAARLDELQKSATSIGVAADQLEALQFAAGQSGASAETLNRALQDMNRRIGEAVTEGGEAEKSFSRFGLSAKILSQQDPAQTFADIAQAISELKTPAEQAAAAQELLGRGSRDLLPLLQQGTEGVNALTLRYQELGLGLGDSRRAAEAFNDAKDETFRLLRNLGDELAVQLIPALTELVRGINAAFEAFNRWRGKTEEVTTSFRTLTKERREQMKAAIAEAEVNEQSAKAAAEAASELEKAAAARKSRADAITQSLRTPGEVFGDTMAELNELLDEGLIKWEVYRRGVEKAAQEVERTGQAAAAIAPEKALSVVTRSSGAFSAIQQAQRNQRNQQKLQEQQLQRLANIEQILRSRGQIQVNQVAIR